MKIYRYFAAYAIMAAKDCCTCEPNLQCYSRKEECVTYVDLEYKIETEGHVSKLIQRLADLAKERFEFKNPKIILYSFILLKEFHTENLK